jgi:exonuclease SbcD
MKSNPKTIFSMRILHTADWHLGKKLDQHDRSEEHQRFLQWLLQTIQLQKVDTLIIAGDIFDTGSPANETLRMYYNFLKQLMQTNCRQTIIIGGNHDSISTLNAPRELLKALEIHVVGGVPDKAEEQIIPLSDENGDIQVVIAAIPFLRDRDVRLSVAGESAVEREQRIKEGIANYYQNLLPLLEEYKKNNIPLIATGHLFAQGATASESEKEIHVGSLGQIPASSFPAG